jgi:nitrous oxidase accessory protein NosD
MYRVWKNCRKNLKLTCPKIQKDIVKAARATTQVILLDDLGDNLFSILIDESRDVSVKEQRANGCGFMLCE